MLWRLRSRCCQRAKLCVDEKIGRTVRGRSYPETGGKNVSALHWDLICDLRPGGKLSADGEVVVQDRTLRAVGVTT